MNVTAAANPVVALDLTKLLVSRDTGPTLQPISEAFSTTMRTDNDPAYRYATIQKDGKTIATINRSGWVEVANGMALPDDLVAGTPGVSLANQRIQQLLKKYGGEVEYAADAATRSATAATLFAVQQASQEHA